MINYEHGVSLRPIDSTSMLQEWRNDQGIRKWCREYRLITKNAQNTWLNSLDEKNLMFTIWVEKDFSIHNDQPVGVCGLTNISYVHRTAEFSIYIALEFQRHGYATMALKTLFDYGFLECGMNRIYGETFDGNPGMVIYDKLGMIKEGTLKESYYKQGKFINSHIYRVLRSEWGRHGKN